MRKHNGIRPQDIVILLKIVSLENKDWKINDLSKELFISQSEVSESLNRSQISGLIDESKRKVRKRALFDFIKYGLKYVFPVKPTYITIGFPTAHSSEPLSKIIISNDFYVWESEKGTMKGQAIEPLYKNVIKAVEKDANLYKLLSLVDVFRVGKPREINLAELELKGYMNFGK